ncbi:MAG: hypothetical protein HFH73_06985 [Lachnospiraceae bacterium]|jgi:hypothetical protein|nr:hypothetical protein [Lachnospiraceae bacterium]
MDVTNEIVVCRCVIENEIGHNTTLIAEGHYDLHRKLDKTLQLVWMFRRRKVLNALLALHKARLRVLPGNLTYNIRYF